MTSYDNSYKAIILPVLILAAWTEVTFVWLYAVRIPATIKAKVNFKKLRTKQDYLNLLPDRVNWVSDNYNHLHEQPTVFYAVCLSMAALQTAQSFDVRMAWLYVAIRIVHSLWQILVNIVEVRFMIFLSSGVVLCILVCRALSQALV